MAGQPLPKLTLVPIAPEDAPSADRLDAPTSHLRLSPRAAAERVQHQPVVSGQRMRRETMLDGHWTILDVSRKDSEVRVLLKAGGSLVSAREREILEAVLSGEADRQISQRMGITRQCVCGHLGNGLAKWGTESRFVGLQVWRILGEAEKGRAGRAFAAEVDYDGEKLLSLRCGIPPRPEIEVRLSSAETHVAWLVCDGMSNRDIAMERGTAERTVANQVASIFTKLEVCRRFDVAQFVLGLR